MREIVVGGDTQVENDSVIADTLADIAGQLAPSTRRLYTQDVRHFAAWLNAEALTLVTLTRSDFIRYRAHLGATYAKSTAARMLTVARRLLAEAVTRDVLELNVAAGVRGFVGSTADETPHIALTKAEARALLDGIDRMELRGQRDYALILLLLRTGMRRAECAALTIGDLQTQQGHHVAVIRHGKGDKRRIVKLGNDVRRILDEYLAATGRASAGKDAPLFVRIRKGGHPGAVALTTEAIADIVETRSRAVGIERLTPHGCRSTFVTLALEAGATLTQTQFAVGHRSPVTTERYAKRRVNLDDNAADHVRF